MDLMSYESTGPNSGRYVVKSVSDQLEEIRSQLKDQKDYLSADQLRVLRKRRNRLIQIEKNRKLMKRFIKVKNNVTADQVGCSEVHFKRYIKDEVLCVTTAMTSTLEIKDNSGERWTISKRYVDDVDVLGFPVRNQKVIFYNG